MVRLSKKKMKDYWKRFWYFIWEDDSVWSWLANIVLAFVLIKFIVYPGLGLIFGTAYPIVAVVSGSMEHPGTFDEWWYYHEDYYYEFGITEEVFIQYPFKNGFNKGDIMVLFGVQPKKISIGDVIVFHGGRSDPIIHRVIKKTSMNSKIYFQTKGDNNPSSIPALEGSIPEDMYIGKAVFRIPYLGYIKIGFVELLRLLHIV